MIVIPLALVLATTLPVDVLDVAAWRAAPAAGVTLALAADHDAQGRRALRLDYDFHGQGGWAAARRMVDLELPADYELAFDLRGEGPSNHLEVKLIDASGDNVWWHVARDVAWPAAWTRQRIRKRQITFAWGPQGGGDPGRVTALELAITAGSGGRGSLWLANLELVPRVAGAKPREVPLLSATSAVAGHPPTTILDGDSTTTWRPTAADRAPTLDLDFGALRELGGLTLGWEPGRVPRRFRVDLSVDGTTWTAGRDVAPGDNTRSDLLLTDSEARWLRLTLPTGACPTGCGLAELTVRPLAWGASVNDVFVALARDATRGTYPRGFSGEQSFWTVVGSAGDAEHGDPDEALLGTDGALELGARRPSLEPFLWLDGRLWTWADVTTEQTLVDGDLPLPTVTWRLPGARLEVSALTAGALGKTAVWSRYVVHNDGPRPLVGRLFLAARPFQVNPPAQFLNLVGGVAPIRRLRCSGSPQSPGGLSIDDAIPVAVAPPADACGTQTFDQGLLSTPLAAGRVPSAAGVDDGFGYASGALAWDLRLPPGSALTVVAATPLAAGTPPPSDVSPEGFDTRAADARRAWRRTVDAVAFDLPPAAEPLVRALRSSLAYVLVHRDGAAIQPGSRGYTRSWIRDGALTGSALLRLGQDAPVRAFARWFAGFQRRDGSVPCCVDHRGADPVVENDSHGELIHLIYEVFRYTGDRAFAAELFPHVAAAVEHIETLRQSRRTAEYQAGPGLAYFGLLPPSISHEGYSDKPAYSYWDDAFAYRGLADAALLAAALDHPELATSWAGRRDELRADLSASVARVMARDHLATLPASADRGDFDSTSTTASLDPGGLLPYLPRPAVEATFERFYRELVARRDGARPWEAFTPYEVRHVGAFLRLGWRARAQELLAYYLDQRQPVGWNQWPEVVTRDPLEPRFLGDLPHGWVASDFIRSLLDAFAYERLDDEALVLAAGVPAAWLDRPTGIEVRGLRTPWGSLNMRLTRVGAGVRYELDGLGAMPAGGLVLTWPLAGPPLAGPIGAATAGGQPLAIAEDGTVVVRQLPAVVTLGPRSSPPERTNSAP